MAFRYGKHLKTLTTRWRRRLRVSEIFVHFWHKNIKPKDRGPKQFSSVGGRTFLHETWRCLGLVCSVRKPYDVFILILLSARQRADEIGLSAKNVGCSWSVITPIGKILISNHFHCWLHSVTCVHIIVDFLARQYQNWKILSTVYVSVSMLSPVLQIL